MKFSRCCGNACYNVPACICLTHTVPYSGMASTVPKYCPGVCVAGTPRCRGGRNNGTECSRTSGCSGVCAQGGYTALSAASAALAALSRAQARTESMSQAIPPIRNHAFVPPPTPSPTATQTLRVLDKVSVRGWGYVLLQRMGPCVILMSRALAADVMGRQYAGRQIQMPCALWITTVGAQANV
jgi:hypothetical protein